MVPYTRSSLSVFAFSTHRDSAPLIEFEPKTLDRKIATAMDFFMAQPILSRFQVACPTVSTHDLESRLVPNVLEEPLRGELSPQAPFLCKLIDSSSDSSKLKA